VKGGGEEGGKNGFFICQGKFLGIEGREGEGLGKQRDDITCNKFHFYFREEEKE